MTTSLLIGASGQLGSALARRLVNAVTPTRAELDLARIRPDSLAALLDTTEPDVVINCAAWTAVDAAETAEDEAILVNGAAVGTLAEAADERRIPFVTFSTDYVFDGTSLRPYTEADPPSPLNAYGRSKLIGEELALRHPGSLVIRTSWVQSATHPCFIRKMVELARDRDVLRVVADQVGRPTFADDLADATLAALDIGVTGLLHVANSGEASWHDLAVETLELAGVEVEVVPVPSSEYETPAERPLNSVLDSSRMTDLGIPRLPTWQSSLRGAVATIMRSYK